ncbi:uncharacterized protein LOC135687231 [Rhopilema esculentum]|uniref:uncharacterized protein LOC135687231 n=1 Tax=Rhopilema esculentum TaxID=499914 RepID=UPI0031D48DC7|eukprot:gene5594-10799_t
MDVATAEKFEHEWCEIERKWMERGTFGARFLKYITEKKELMKSSMMAGVRETCSLGIPPLEYTQNANECINSILKNSKEKRAISLKETARLIHKEVISQDERLKLAIISKGAWKIRSEFASKLQVEEVKFYQMNQAQRDCLTKRFNSFIPPYKSTESERQKDVSASAPCISLPNLLLRGFPTSIQQEIQKEACKLLNESGRIIHGPAESNLYMVTNKRQSSQPHLVTYDKSKNKAICQSKFCFRGKGFGICGHAVAVAKKENFLAKFVQQFNKNSPADSVSRLVDAGKEKRAGQKKTKATQKRKGPANSTKEKVMKFIERQDRLSQKEQQQQQIQVATQPLQQH